MNAATKAATRVGFIFALAICSVSSAADPAGDVAALEAVDQAWAKAYNAGDVDAIANLYDEQAVLLPPGAPAASGRAAIREFFTKDVAGSQAGGVSMSIGIEPAGGATGELGWSSGKYVVKDKAGQVLDTGKYLSVSVKKDGKWLYLRDTWNSDGPATTAAPNP
jgi:uncharacterized protein (TIGR02246 family)